MMRSDDDTISDAKYFKQIFEKYNIKKFNRFSIWSYIYCCLCLLEAFGDNFTKHKAKILAILKIKFYEDVDLTTVLKNVADVLRLELEISSNCNSKLAKTKIFQRIVWDYF